MDSRQKDNDLQACRETMTFQEREILALERISDQLSLLVDAVRDHCSSLMRNDRQAGNDSEPSEKALAWENEGGSIREAI
jgi:hypothetical protein